VIGAGTVINPIIKIVTTVVILAVKRAGTDDLLFG
jgi:hypothetical protein